MRGFTVHLHGTATHPHGPFRHGAGDAGYLGLPDDYLHLCRATNCAGLCQHSISRQVRHNKFEIPAVRHGSS